MVKTGGKLKVYIDGGSRGNPGPGACAAVFFDEKGLRVKETGKYLGPCTNNAAEYNALMLALSASAKLGAERLEIFSDSELLVRQFNGKYKIKEPALMALMAEIKGLAAGFKSLALCHIPRSANKHADALVNKILDGAGDAVPRAESQAEKKKSGLYQPNLF